MKRFMCALTISFVVFSLFTVNSFAQRGAGWGAMSQYNKMCDINTVETITGEGNETIIFRDKNGHPLWSGSRRK
jgi:hypothetical protein